MVVTGSVKLLKLCVPHYCHANEAAKKTGHKPAGQPGQHRAWPRNRSHAKPLFMGRRDKFGRVSDTNGVPASLTSATFNHWPWQPIFLAHAVAVMVA